MSENSICTSCRLQLLEISGKLFSHTFSIFIGYWSSQFKLHLGKYLSLQKCVHSVFQFNFAPSVFCYIKEMTVYSYSFYGEQCFCSNFCYKASKYFEGQISKTPVWLREEERYLDHSYFFLWFLRNSKDHALFVKIVLSDQYVF